LCEVSCAPGPFGDQFERPARMLLEDIRAGRPVQRRDAIRLARFVLENAAVRLAEAVLEAGDTELLVPVLELLEATINPARESCGRDRARS
jgi:hypothetical protein